MCTCRGRVICFAPNPCAEGAFATLFGDCGKKGVTAVNKPPACSLAALMKLKDLKKASRGC